MCMNICRYTIWTIPCARRWEEQDCRGDRALPVMYRVYICIYIYIQIHRCIQIYVRMHFMSHHTAAKMSSHAKICFFTLRWRPEHSHDYIHVFGHPTSHDCIHVFSQPTYLWIASGYHEHAHDCIYVFSHPTSHDCIHVFSHPPYLWIASGCHEHAHDCIHVFGHPTSYDRIHVFSHPAYLWIAGRSHEQGLLADEHLFFFSFVWLSKFTGVRVRVSVCIRWKNIYWDVPYQCILAYITRIHPNILEIYWDVFFERMRLYIAIYTHT